MRTSAQMSNPKIESPRTDENGSGFTLIEVLLAVVITGLLLAGIYNLFGSQEKSQVLVDQMAELNQNLRVAAAMIARDMRMAGYHVEQGFSTTALAGDIRAITVTEGGDNPDTVTLLYADATVSTTILTDMGNESEGLQVASIIGFKKWDLVVITDGVNTSLFCLTEVNSNDGILIHNSDDERCSPYNDPDGHENFPQYAAGARVFKARLRTYSIDRTDPSRPRLMLQEAPEVAQPLVDYVEDLQLERARREDGTPVECIDPDTLACSNNETDGAMQVLINNCTAYVLTITGRTRKPLPGIGGIRRKSITETVRVRNISCPTSN